MKNKILDIEFMMAADDITHGKPFTIEGRILKAQPQQNPLIQPCQECKMGVRCNMATSKLCEYADFVHAQSCILVDA